MELSKETETNIRALIQIRDDLETSPAVRIQAIQTMQKIIDALGASSADDRPSEEDIMSKIRGKKK
jgi:hypothetical protein